MHFLLLLAVLVVCLLGTTAIRHIAWWLFIVLPTASYTVWQFSQAWHSSAHFWYAVANVVLIAVIGNDLARKDAERASPGEPPMSKAEIKRSMIGR
jgi:uncharacterized membrane protein